MSVTPDAMPTLVTIPNVELVTVGEWDASTGTVEFTAEHLAAAVAALNDPAVKQPRARIGHTDASTGFVESQGGFADQPVFGRFVNLRLNSTGTTLYADLAGVPAWLAEILPSAYPSRSIEAWFDYTTKTGHKHPMVIGSVSLLGEKRPAVETLEDLRLAFGDEAPEWVQADSGRRVVATRKDNHMPEQRVDASVAAEDVRQSFYLDFAEGDRYWWWIYRFYVAPALLIADDDEGGYWAVPYTVNGNTISWGDPYEVEMQWVASDGGKVVANAPDTDSTQGAVVFASAAESRPRDRVRAAQPTKEERMTATASPAVLERLGLPEDATEEQVLAALDAQPGAGSEEEETAPPAPAETVEQPVAAAQVDPDALRQLQEDAKLGREAREAQLQAEREQIVDERIKGGFITPASRNAHLAELAKGGEIEQTHRAYLAGLTAAIVPVDERSAAPADETAAVQSQVQAGLAAAGIRPKERS